MHKGHSKRISILQTSARACVGWARVPLYNIDERNQQKIYVFVEMGLADEKKLFICGK